MRLRRRNYRIGCEWGGVYEKYGVVVNYNTMLALGKRPRPVKTGYSGFLPSLLTVLVGAECAGRMPETMSVMTSAA